MSQQGIPDSGLPGAGSATPAINSPSDFAYALLAQLGITSTPGAVQAIIAWAHAEGGNWNNTATFNPLNTTQAESGSHGINSVNVQAYTSWEQGLAATVATLKNGRYGDILANLATGNAQQIASSASLNTWGTGNFTKDLAGATPGPAPADLPQGTTPDVSATAAGNTAFTVPKDGAVFNVAGIGPVMVYDLGNGLKVYFSFGSTNVQQLMGQQYVLGSGMAPNLTAAQFAANAGPGWSPTSNMVNGGSIEGLAGLESLQAAGGTQSSDPLSGASFVSWMKDKLNVVSGGRADWQADPQIAGLLVQRVIGKIDDATLQVDIQQTNFWKTHTSQQTSWENLSPADQAQKVASEVSNLQTINSNWGIPAGDLTAAATNIANGTSTEDQYTQTLQKQATVMYPWMADFAKQNIDTKTAAAPWLSTYANTMEKPADLMNAQVQKALTSGTPVYQFEQDLKNSPDWLQTKNAAQDLSTNAASIGRLMGFS